MFKHIIKQHFTELNLKDILSTMFTQPALTEFVPLSSSHLDCEADNCKAPATTEITRRDPDEYHRGEGGLYITNRCDPHAKDYIHNIDGGMITFTVELPR